MPLGNRIRQFRELAGLSQNELAKRANLPQSVLSAVERGQQSVYLETAKRIADALGVTLDLLAGDGEPENTTKAKGHSMVKTDRILDRWEKQLALLKQQLELIESGKMGFGEKIIGSKTEEVKARIIRQIAEREEHIRTRKAKLT